MYPWDKVEPGKDTTMRIIKECVDRGFEVSYLTKKDISIAKGKVVGNCKKMLTKFRDYVKQITKYTPLLLMMVKKQLFLKRLLQKTSI